MEYIVVIVIIFIIFFLFSKLKNKKYPQKKGKGTWIDTPKDDSNPMEDVNEKGY